jgi:aspartate racemase
MIAPHPILGIIGGMGPEATVEFMARIVRATPALTDADHLHMIVDNNPRVPSRIKALVEGTGESPEPELIRMAQALEAAGANFLAMPCNTAHGYAQAIAAAVRIPLLDMVALAAQNTSRSGKTVGLLASTAVIRLGLYHRAFGSYGRNVRVPDEQDLVMEIITDIKRGDTGKATRESFTRIVAGLAARGADVMLVACTELSLLTDSLGTEVPVIDSLDVLRDAVLDHAGLGRK